jgi:hypothetical protein
MRPVLPLTIEAAAVPMAIEGVVAMVVVAVVVVEAAAGPEEEEGRGGIKPTAIHDGSQGSLLIAAGTVAGSP